MPFPLLGSALGMDTMVSRPPIIIKRCLRVIKKQTYGKELDGEDKSFTLDTAMNIYINLLCADTRMRRE